MSHCRLIYSVGSIYVCRILVNSLRNIAGAFIGIFIRKGLRKVGLSKVLFHIDKPGTQVLVKPIDPVLGEKLSFIKNYFLLRSYCKFYIGLFTPPPGDIKVLSTCHAPPQVKQHG